MSIFHLAQAVCSACGTRVPVERSASVNADRRPDLRRAILDGSFQSAACPKCATRLRLPPHLSYFDLARGLWIMVEPVDRLEDWRELEAEARLTHARSFGAEGPGSAALGAGIRPRLVFGWAALREKLLCAELGLDDIVLELLKIAIMRHVEDPPLADETELRLVGGTAEQLQFSWLEAASEARLASLEVPRDIYDGVAGDVAWLPMRAGFEDVLLVDLRRLIMGSDTADLAAGAPSQIDGAPA